MPRQNYIQFRANDIEKSHYQHLANLAGMPLALWVRSVLNEKIKKNREEENGIQRLK